MIFVKSRMSHQSSSFHLKREKEKFGNERVEIPWRNHASEKSHYFFDPPSPRPETTENAIGWRETKTKTDLFSSFLSGAGYIKPSITSSFSSPTQSFGQRGENMNENKAAGERVFPTLLRIKFRLGFRSTTASSV